MLVLGSDKSGFSLKEAIKSFLISEGIAFEDIGTRSVDAPMPYYDVARAAARMIQSGASERGILVCGTGTGMSVVANKHKGVYAAAAESVYSAKMARAINNAQVLCLGGWITAPELAAEMVKAFLETSFLQGLEDWRQKFLINAAVEVAAIEGEIYGGF